MADLLQVQPQMKACRECGKNDGTSVLVVRLQILTLAWMSVECGLALFAAYKGSSPALLAFGSDSLVELLSAAVVILQFAPSFAISPPRAARCAGVLLFVLAGVVAFTSVAALAVRLEPEANWLGIAVSIAALVAMPVLSRAKRRAAQRLNNRALAADAVQSATCAYLAGITLFGLAINAVFHIRWIDPAAALGAIPIICIEAKRALRGEVCGCC